MEDIKMASNDDEYEGYQNVTFYLPCDNRDILQKRQHVTTV